ncbi:MAG: DUF559 domain-containing protein [Pseudomonadota bacterium]
MLKNIKKSDLLVLSTCDTQLARSTGHQEFFDAMQRVIPAKYRADIVQYLLCVINKTDFKQWQEKEIDRFSFVLDLIIPENYGTESANARYYATALYKIATIIITLKEEANILFTYPDVSLRINLLITKFLSAADRFPSPKEHSDILWFLAKLVEANHIQTLNASQITELLTELYTQRVEADFNKIADALWAIEKLVEAKQLPMLNSSHVEELLTELYMKRAKANPKNIANVFSVMAKLVEANKIQTFNGSQVTELFSVLHTQRAQANPQVIANTLWAMVKLVEANKIQTFNASQVTELFSVLHTQHAQAKPQEIANTLWAMAKLVEANPLLMLDASQVTGLFSELHTQRAQANPQVIGNTLWAMAKLVEANPLLMLDASQVTGLFSELHTQRAQANTQVIANTLWAIAILQKRFESLCIVSINDLQKYFFELIEQQNFVFTTKEASQVCQAFVLEGKNFPEYLYCKLLEQKPRPNQQQFELVKLLKLNFPKGKIETEFLIGAWFVDVCMIHDDDKIVIELDGSHHYLDSGELRSKDQRRDDWLRTQDYKIIRCRNNTTADLYSQILSELEQRFSLIPDIKQLSLLKKEAGQEDVRSLIPQSASEEMPSNEPAFQEVVYKKNKKASEKQGRPSGSLNNTSSHFAPKAKSSSQKGTIQLKSFNFH